MSLREIISDKEKVRQINKAVFGTVDIDQSSFIERNELEAIMQTVAKDLKVPPPSKDEVDDILKEFDVDKDGKISLEEFQGLIEQVLTVMAQSEEGRV